MKKADRHHKFRPLKLTAGICAALVLSACGGNDQITPTYNLENCRRVALYDSGTGIRVNGAEDIAIDRAGGRLFVSAYNRRAVEKAVKSKASSIPSGGVYVLPLEMIDKISDSLLTVTPLALPAEFSGGLRPHGINYDAHADEIVFVNRGFEKTGRSWRLMPRIERIGAGGEVFMGRAKEAPCSANDIYVQSGKTYASFDHGSCRWGGALEDIFSLKRSGISLNGEVVYGRANFANGLTQTLGGDLILAATREKSLLMIDSKTNDLKLLNRIKLPGGPDNLTISEDGNIIAALHPSLLKMGLHRKMNIGRAPSRIVKIDPDLGTVDILYDDPSGALFTAATVGVEWGKNLILGSVTDDGLLVCRKG